MSDNNTVNVSIISGTITFIGEVEEVGAKKHKKQIVAIDTGGQYPQVIGVEFFGKNQPLVDNLDLQVGDVVRAHCNVNGREFKGRYFTSMSAWKVESDAESAPPPTQRRDRGGTPPAPPPGPEDDIPFLSCELGAEPSPIWRPFRA